MKATITPHVARTVTLTMTEGEREELISVLINWYDTHRPVTHALAGAEPFVRGVISDLRNAQ